MRPFIEKTISKVEKLNNDQLRSILKEVALENDRLEAALQSTLDGIVVCSFDHFPIFVNKSAERILRMGNDWSAAPLWESIGDEEIRAFFHKNLLEEETVLGQEFALENLGSTRIIAISLTALLSRGRIAGTLVHIEDITDKRKKETQLRRAESLAALTTLAAGVAHEIKNPLGSISIHVQLLKKALRSNSKAEKSRISHHLDIVEEEIDRLNKIVVDFLFAVRPMDINLISEDPGQLLTELADFVQYEAEKLGITIDLDVKPDLPRVLMDRKYLKQALLNLLKNAMAAMPNGGTLGIKAENDENELKLSISDTGIGIPDDQQTKIFEPYFTTKENGTGLGLTITFKIVKEHSGDISVVSKPGKGSVFTIHLPVPQSEKKALPRWEESTAVAGTHTEV
jgi:PAS domain S-box-containing protein